MRLRAAHALVVGALVALAGGCDDRAPIVLESRVVSDTNHEAGPYEVLAVARDESGIERARLYWQAGGIAESAPMEGLADERQAENLRLGAVIPGQPLGTEVRWGLELCDTRGNCATDPEGFPEESHSFRVGILPSSPSIDEVAPAAGPTSGGTRVEIRGEDFRPGALVRFGDVEATHTERVRSDVLVALTPAHEAGEVDVTVENPDGSLATLPDAFAFFPAPELFGVDPPSGPASGGTDVVLLGANLAEGVRAFFDDVPCRHLERVSENELRCQTPPGHPGFVDVEVRHSEIGFGRLEDAYLYVAPPRIDAVSPDRGADLGGTTIEVVGESFTPDTVVLVDGAPCAELVFVDESTLRCTVPPGEPGVVDVEVVNPDGQRDRLHGGFNYLGPPVVLQVLPEAGPLLGGVQVRVLGAGFTEEMAVFFGDALAQVIEVVDSLEIVVELPAAAVPLAPAPESGLLAVDVTVVSTDPGDGRSDVLEGGFTYFWPPEITEVVPDRGPTSGGTQVTIVGRFFRAFDDGVFRVAFGEGEASGVDILSSTTLGATTPPGPAGFVDVTVENFERSSGTLEEGFLYIPPPEVDRVVPGDGPTFGGDRVTLIGRFFQPGAQILFGDVPCLDVAFLSETELQCTTPPGDEGFVDVTVINPDGQQGSRPMGYRYLGVVVSPDVGLPVGFTRVVIRAAGIQPGATVRFGSALVTDCVVVSARELVCQTPPNPLGSVDVSFTNPDGTGDTAEGGFAYRELVDRTTGRLPGTAANSNHVEAVDVDLDGDLDLLVANGTPSGPEPDEMFLNDGLGGFSRQLLGTPLAVSNKVTPGDLNGDDLPDFVVAVSDNDVGGAFLLRNDGDGLLTQVETPGASDGAFDAQLIDLVGDARDDLFILSIGCSNFGMDPNDPPCDASVIGRDALFERTGAQGFTDRSSLVPHDDGLRHDHKLVAEDLDHDGDRDIVLLVDNDNFPGSENRHRILFNRIDEGLGFVEDRAPFAGLVGDIFGIDSGDIDGDGNVDVVAPSCLPDNGSSELVFRGDGSSLVQDFSAMPATAGDCDVGVHLTDIDTDGDLDLVFTGMTSSFGFQVKLYVNRGDGTFVDASAHVPFFAGSDVQGTEIASGDFDGDGDVDLAVSAVSLFSAGGAGDLRLLLLE